MFHGLPILPGVTSGATIGATIGATHLEKLGADYQAVKCQV
jgi:hypothetical protein